MATNYHTTNDTPRNWINIHYFTVDAFMVEYRDEICNGWLSVPTSKHYVLGQLVDLRLYLPGPNHPVKAVGQVVMVDRGDDRRTRGIGLHLCYVDPVDGEIMKNLYDLHRLPFLN